MKLFTVKNLYIYKIICIYTYTHKVYIYEGLSIYICRSYDLQNVFVVIFSFKRRKYTKRYIHDITQITYIMVIIILGSFWLT